MTLQCAEYKASFIRTFCHKVTRGCDSCATRVCASSDLYQICIRQHFSNREQRRANTSGCRSRKKGAALVSDSGTISLFITAGTARCPKYIKPKQTSVGAPLQQPRPGDSSKEAVASPGREPLPRRDWHLFINRALVRDSSLVRRARLRTASQGASLGWAHFPGRRCRFLAPRPATGYVFIGHTSGARFGPYPPVANCVRQTVNVATGDLSHRPTSIEMSMASEMKPSVEKTLSKTKQNKRKQIAISFR